MTRSIGDALTRSRLRYKSRSPRKALPVHLAVNKTVYSHSVGFGKQSLEAYIKQQKTVRRSKIKVTLPKLGES